MASFSKEHEIVFDVTCGTCGTSLDCDENEYRGSLELKVEPCDKCISEKDSAIESLTDDYEQQLINLEDELEALKIEMTYKVIKTNEQ